jgi:hypothetical protein
MTVTKTLMRAINHKLPPHKPLLRSLYNVYNSVTMLQILLLTKWIFIHMSIIHNIILSRVADKKKGRVLANGWTHPSSMTKNCHPKKYQCNIKYYTTLNITGSVVSMHTDWRIWYNLLGKNDTLNKMLYSQQVSFNCYPHINYRKHCSTLL